MNAQEAIRNYIPEPYSSAEMSARPGPFIPALRFILQQYTADHMAAEQNEKSKTLPRLFSLTPKPSLHWRFIDIDAKTLASLVELNMPRTQEQNAQVFKTVFCFDQYRFFE